MNITRVTLTILSFLATITSFAQKKCVLKGEVIDRSSKVLLLKKCSEGFQYFLNNPVRINVSNGTFNHSFSYNETEAYEIIFEDELEQGTWASIPFFPVEGTVEFKLNPKEDHQKNNVTGGSLNAEYEAYQKNRQEIFESRRSQLLKISSELFRTNEYYSTGYNELRAQLKVISPDDHDAKVPVYKEMEEMRKTHTVYTEKAKQVYVDPDDSLTRAEMEWKYEYIRQNISLVSYYLVWRDVQMQLKDNAQLARLVTSIYPLFQKKFPDHIYTRLIGTQLEGLQTINIGNRFVDFKAPTLAGDSVQLSGAIKNKIALINFWGSWCGPCIAKTRLIAPLYERYKNQGFTIVGIAREFKTTDAVKKRLDKEHFPWINLVELDDRLNIWTRYGIANGTGLMVLVDSDGTILALDPGPEELDNMLKKKLTAN